VVKHFAVFGNPINHSLSPIIHQYFAKQAHIKLIYQKIRVEEQTFEQELIHFFSQGGSGLNSTLPLKQKAFALAKQVTPACMLAGAANTLWMHEDILYADNTDGIGLIRDLKRYVPLQEARVLIVGAGGAARGIIHPLLENNPKILVVASRSKANLIEWQQTFPQVTCVAIEEVKEPFDLIINATSASLKGELVKLPQVCFSQKPFCYDLTYKQSKATVFVDYARSLGCSAVDGLGMLVEQAAEAFFIWHQYRPETQPLLNFLRGF
jgi:shikimate dehydrogenase